MKIASWNIYIPHDKSKQVEFDIVYGEPESSWLGIHTIEDGYLYNGKISFESFMKNDYLKNKQFQFLIDNSTKIHVEHRWHDLHYLMSKVCSHYYFCDENQSAYTCYEFGVLGMGWNEDMFKLMSKKIAYIKKKILESGD
jgi:hypothetical protein